MYTKEALHRAEVQVSEALESHEIPDVYIWSFNREGKLIPKYDETPIENIIYKDNPIAKIEYDAFLKIQERAFRMDSGFIIWISPIHPVYYPKTSKIIVTEKKGEILLNRSFNTNWDNLGSLLVARELACLSELDPLVFKSTTDVRANPIFVSEENEEMLALALKNMLDKKSIEMMASGADFATKEKYMDEYLSGKQIVYGSGALSCPTGMLKPTAFQIFSGEDEYGSLQFECPHCHGINTRPPHELISSCQSCGADIRCKISI